MLSWHYCFGDCGEAEDHREGAFGGAMPLISKIE
jgi:hypothetical protein